MRKIFFDIETRNIFDDVGKADPTLLDISIVCAFDSETNEYTSYLQEELHKLWPLIEKADMLVTFNGDYFDIPLLNKYYGGDLTKIKSLDLLTEVKKSLGRRVGLGNIAEATLGVGKSANGLEAVKWWKEGNIEDIRKYCIQDVKVTKEVYEYALKNGKLKYKDGETVKEINIDASSWETKPEESGAMNFSLPF
ncbi:MAG TPA: ribonuclease H-like domain-containing protein [Candidatus Paceibacterota bacterium]|nr:ribonuclease H-like domain-containing protein [Candidatus Paceibacterota bacterium]